MIALIVSSLLCVGCSSTGEPSVPPADEDLARTVRRTAPSSASPRTNGPLRERRRIGDDTRVALPGDRELRLSRDGAAWVGGANAEGPRQLAFATDSFVSTYFEVLAGHAETTVVIGNQLTGVPGDSGTLRLFRFATATGDKAWDAVMSTDMDFDEAPGTHHPWRVLDAGTRLLVVEPRRIVAVDSATGKHAWTFGALESSFPSQVWGGELTEHFRKTEIDDAVVDGDTLVVHARDKDDATAERVEIDLASGDRVWRTTTRPVPPIVALADLHRIELHASPPVHDDPPPPQRIPVVAEGWDLRAVGHALLVWNTKTGKGVIFNPTMATREAVIEQAHALRVEDDSGRARAITWTAVVDTRALAQAFERRPKASADESAAVRFSYSAGLGLRWTGGRLDVDGVARELGIAVVRTRADAAARGLGFTVARIDGPHPSVRVRVGEIDVVDDIGWPDAGPLHPL